jgi:hypothetical protein
MIQLARNRYYAQRWIGFEVSNVRQGMFSGLSAAFGEIIKKFQKHELARDKFIQACEGLKYLTRSRVILVSDECKRNPEACVKEEGHVLGLNVRLGAPYR